MNLHLHPVEFTQFIRLTSKHYNIPESAIERDYYIVLLLKNLAESSYSEQCVFKGGTSLSKCYPGSIERFSEDIDLSYLGLDKSNRFCDKELKSIEKVIVSTASMQKITSERSQRNKSAYVWFSDKNKKIKLEIGCNVRPEPYSKKTMKTYIHVFLESHNDFEEIDRYNLQEIELNVLNIERTFIDKIFAVKRHAYCGTLNNKVRHIYDVTKLYYHPSIQQFLRNKSELNRIIQITKETDAYYLAKRNINKDYNPLDLYNFNEWSHFFHKDIKYIYEHLHETLLYTTKSQNFDDAIFVFSELNNLLCEINQ
jgi:predicted nucleotidyltransferase component of viral defense system